MVSSSVVLCEKSDEDSDKSSPRSFSQSPILPSCSNLQDRLNYFENKLANTVKLLKSKDDMLRIHEDSLKVAEEHVQTLTERNSELQKELDIKLHELKLLKGSLGDQLEDSTPSPPAPPRRGCASKVDADCLQNDLAAVKKLYRDCFYESAKQEEQIELLQDALTEMKSRDIEKSDEIHRLGNLLTNQRWTLNNCQDLIEEVENLKIDVNSTLDNINASERLFAAWSGIELTADLMVIRHLLHQLKDDLNTDCMFELQEENNTLRLTIENLEVQIANVKQQSKLEFEKRALEIQQLKKRLETEQTVVEELKERLKSAEREHEEVDGENSVLLKEKLALEIKVSESQKNLQEQKASLAATQQMIDNLKEKLKESKALVTSKTAQLELLQAACQNHETTIATLKEHLDRAEVFVKENVKLRSDVTYLNNQCAFWRAQTLEREAKIKQLDDEALATRLEFQQLHQLYQDELEVASSRGEEMCTESKHFVWGVKKWMERMKEKYRAAKLKNAELSADNESLKSRLEFYKTQIKSTDQPVDNKPSWNRQQLRKGFRNVRSDNIRLKSLIQSSEESSCDSSLPRRANKLNQKKSSEINAASFQGDYGISKVNLGRPMSTTDEKHRMSSLIMKVKDSIQNRAHTSADNNIP